MRIEIVNIVPPKTEQKGSNSYQILDVAYKTDQGKVAGKKLVSFTFPEVFEAISKAQRGDLFDVDAVKEGKFWNWRSISKADAGSAAPTAPSRQGNTTPGGRVTGSNYETPAEREWNRTRIGRQACLNTAVALSAANGSKLKLEAVIADAAALEKWVTRLDPNIVDKEKAKNVAGQLSAMEGLTDDIPF